MPNTRELAQIIDKETGDVNNLRDKKLADATVQQQSGSASTDSVMMKTTGGEYVEIARDSFVGAIKSVMDGLIKGNSYTTLGANDPIAAFNSNALGGITPANLASVLGVNTIPTVYWARRYNEGFALHRYDYYAPNESDIGIGFFDGGHLIVVAFDETALPFSSNSFTTNYGGSIPTQMTNGKTCRELTEAHAAAIGEGVNCAAGYCLAYQASGDIQRYWALPGIREWFAINKHVTEINKALQKNGSTIIGKEYYWTANTYANGNVYYSRDYAALIDWNTGNYQRTYNVRPVLTF